MKTAHINPTPTSGSAGQVARNEAGGKAYTVSKKTELVLRTLPLLFGEPDFYKQGDVKSAEFLECVRDCAATEDPEFALKTMDYASNVFGMRTAPIVGMIEWINFAAGTVPHARDYVPRILRRADMLMLALDYQNTRNLFFPRKKAIPNMLTYGLADAIHQFDEHQLTKWDAEKSRPSKKKMVARKSRLHDVLNLCHPVPRDESEADFFARVVKSNGAYRHSGEAHSIQQALGANDGRSAKEHYEKFLEEDKLGLLGLIYNLNAMIRNNVNTDLILTKLINKDAVQKSKVFPFQLMTAYRAVKMCPITQDQQSARSSILEALEVTVEISTENVPTLPGITAAWGDSSGSMTSPISTHSGRRGIPTQRVDISNTFLSIVPHIAKEYHIGLFDTTARWIELDKGKTVVENKKTIDKMCRGGGTYAYKLFDLMTQNNTFVDRVMMFSDMQCYGPQGGMADFEFSYTEPGLAEAYARYKKEVNPDVHLYTIDLCGNGTAQIPESDTSVCMLAGFSMKIFDFIEPFEEDRETLISKIEQYRS